MRSKFKSVGYKLYLSVQCLIVTIGVGFIVIGLPITAYDKYVIKEAQNCFDENFKDVKIQIGEFTWNLSPIDQPSTWKETFDPDKYLENKNSTLIFSESGYLKGPAHLERELLEKCGISNISIENLRNSEEKPVKKISSSRVITDNNPKYSIPLFIATFLFCFSVALFLFKEWLSWLFR